MLENNSKQEKLIEYIRNNEQKIYRVAYSYMKNEEFALDTVQDAVEKAIRKVTTVKEEKYLETWFYRILINQSLTNLRKNKVKELFKIEEEIKEDKIEDKIDIYQCLEELKPKLKTVIILRFFEDRKIDEIAQITNTNSSTVKSRLYKALQELKGKLVENENK